MALAVLLLSGCPQLMQDDFTLLHGSSTGSVPDGDVPLRDAGPDLSSSDGADASADPVPEAGGAGGSGPSEPDAAVPATAKDAAAPDAALNDAGSSSEEPDSGTPVDAGTTEDPNISALRGALVHRYRFDPGATLVDSVGSADAVSVGVTFSAGAAVFGGGSYLDLPNDLLSGLTNTTFETWVIWTADPSASTSNWQRIFDFGSNSSTEGQQGSSASGIFLSPQSSGSPGKLHVQYKSSAPGSTNINIDAPNSLPAQVVVQLDVVVDESAHLFWMYQDGLVVGSLSFPASPPATPTSLTTVTYLNNWLGRSQYTGDPPFQGQILDFRIYSAALTTAQIHASHTAGPDLNL